MLEFYTWPSGVCLFITFLFALCVLSQTLALIFCLYRYPKGKILTLGILLESVVLFEIFCLSLLHGQVYQNFDNGFALSVGYEAERVISFVTVVIAAVSVSVLSRAFRPLIAIVPSLVVLPAAEVFCGAAYPWLYLMSLLCFLIRGVIISLGCRREIKTGLSAFSVKSAIDNLPSGVLFSRRDGRILLISSRMQQLMVQIAGEVYQNGNRFYEQLFSDGFDIVCEREEMKGQIVCLLPDKKAWMFTRTVLKIKGSQYVQLTASDVTERFLLTVELKEQGEALKVYSEELKQTIADLQELIREREIRKAKMRAHDVLGQRLTLLLHMVRGEKPTEPAALKVLSEGLLAELSAGPELPAPLEEIDKLRQVFGSIGAEIVFDGALPAREVTARLFIDIIKESVTNAVRHGFASEISVHSFRMDGIWFLNIQNNGHPPLLPIIEGGGIGGMRERLAPEGGTLELLLTPRFTVSITLPGGEA